MGEDTCNTYNQQRICIHNIKIIPTNNYEKDKRVNRKLSKWHAKYDNHVKRSLIYFVIKEI